MGRADCVDGADRKGKRTVDGEDGGDAKRMKPTEEVDEEAALNSL
jgi:hypothetical protein